IQLSKIGNHVRTYSVSRGLDQVPCIAAEIGLKGVGLGIELHGVPGGTEQEIERAREGNEREISKALRTVRDCPGVIDRVFVGNETVLTGELTVEEVTTYMMRVKRDLPRRIPV